MALVHGLLESGTVAAENIWATNRRDDQRLWDLRQRLGINTGRQAADAIAAADVVVLAVKPADVDTALPPLADLLNPQTLVISVIAGVPLANLINYLGGHTRIVRAMPNTAARVGRSITAVHAGPGCDENGLALALDIFASIGKTVVIPEEQFDAVTAISGSGPAYVFVLLEAMVEAGCSLGLAPEVARSLAVETVLGAGSLMQQTALEPAELRAQVTSPGGTTAAALAVMEQADVPVSLRRAIVRAAQRSAELSAPDSMPKAETGPS